MCSLISLLGRFGPWSEVQKGVGFWGLKNWLSLTSCQAQEVGLVAFVSLGAPEARFFNHKSLCNLSYLSSCLFYQVLSCVKYGACFLKYVMQKPEQILTLISLNAGGNSCSMDF